MKRHLLLLAAILLLCPWVMKSQTTVLSEGFDGASIPSGWTLIDADGDNMNWKIASAVLPSGTITGYAHNGSSNFVLSESYDDENYNALTPDNWLVTPAVTLDSAGMLSFWICAGSVYYISEHWGVYISTTSATDTGAFTLLYEETIQPDPSATTNHSTWTEHTFNLSAYAGQTVYVAFRHFNCTDQLYLHLDDVYLGPAPTCPPPSNLVVAAVDVTTAQISWTSNGTNAGYEVYVAPASAAVDLSSVTWTTVNAGTTYTFSGLLSSTQYNAYVRADCGSEYSTYAVVGFTTLNNCSNMPVPYLEDFNSYSNGIATSTLTPSSYPNVDLPACWTFLNRGATSSQYPLAFLSSSQLYTVSGNCLFLKSNRTKPLYAILPEFQESIHHLRLGFTYRNEGTAAADGILHVGYMTSLTDDSTFVTLYSCPRTSTLTEVTLSFDTVPVVQGTHYYIAFKYEGGSFNNHYLSLDNLSVIMIPTCEKPAGLNVAAAGSDEVSLTWTEMGTASVWNVAYGLAGFNPDTVVVNVQTVSTTPSITISGLQTSTTYDFYVRADCGSGVSEWCGPLTHTTGLYKMHTTGWDTLATCGIVVSDDGGLSGSYSTYCNAYLVLYPDLPGGYLRITGTVTTETSYDYFRLYDGSDTLATYIELTGSNQTVDFISSNGPALLYFYSDGMISDAGFELAVSCVSCSSPTLSLASVDVNEATFSWSSTSATNFEIVFGPAGFDPDTALPYFLTNVFTYTVTGLTPNTSYQAYIRADCGGDYGNWTVLSFNTPNVSAATLPYHCGFENAAENGAWTMVNGTQSNKWHIGDAVSNGGDNALYVSGYNGTNNDYNGSSTSVVWAYRDIVFGSSPSFQLSFDWRCEGESTYDYMRVFIGGLANVSAGSINAPVGATMLGQFNQDSTWHTFSVLLPGQEYANTTKRLYFYWENDYMVGNNPAAAIDNISIDPLDCFYPQVSVTDPTTSGITVHIEPAALADASWEIAISDTIVFSLQDTAYEISTLLPGTTYTMMVRTLCSSGDTSLWSPPITFTTACFAATVPYTQGFEGLPTGASSFLNCWNRHSTYSSSYSSTGTASLFFYSSSGTYDMAVSPEIDLTAHTMDQLQVSFAMRNNVSTSLVGMVVGVMTDPSDPATFVPVDTVFNSTLNVFQYFDVPLASYSGNGAYVALKSYNAYGNSSIYVDDFSVTEMVLCVRPIDLQVTASTTTSVTLSWTEMGAATAWEIEYGAPGFAQGSGTIVTAGTNPFEVTNLASGINYQFYVRAACDSATRSEWCNPIIGHPACDLMAVPYVETFDEYTYGIAAGYTTPTTYPDGDLPTCWDFLNRSLSSSSYPIVFLTTYSNYAAAGKCLFFKSSIRTPIYAILPEFQEEISNLKLHFMYRNQGSGIHNGTLYVGYMTDRTDTSTFTTLFVCPQNTTITPIDIAYDTVPTVPGTRYHIAFKYVGGQASNYYLSLDSVRVDLLPVELPCDAPVDVVVTNITETTADVSWTQSDNAATSWDVEYRETGATAWNSVTTSGSPHTLTGLTAETSYEVQVTAHCTNGLTSDPSSTATFATLPDGIADYVLDRMVTLYPNPTTGLIQVLCTEEGMEGVEVYDTYGRLLHTTTVSGGTATLNLSGYAKGTYFVKVTTDRGVVTKRVVKM